MELKKTSAKETELYVEIETFLKKLFAGYYILIYVSFQLHVIYGLQ